MNRVVLNVRLEDDTIEEHIECHWWRFETYTGHMKKRKSNYYNQRFYAIFRRDESGKLWGYIEYSFSMGWDTKLVRIWPEDRFKSRFFGNKVEMDKWMHRSNYILVRVNSKKCPVHIELDEITEDMRNFEFRNKKFTIKNDESSRRLLTKSQTV